MNKTVLKGFCVFVALCFLMPIVTQISVGVEGKMPEGIRAAGGVPGKPGGGGGGGGGSEPTTNKIALVIGISNYDGTRYDLQYCDDDARDWANYLKGKGYTVHTLIDGQATLSGIESEVAWLDSAENVGDEVAFCYSGHGIKAPKLGSCILTSDLYQISYKWFVDKFSTFSSTEIFFCFDACQIGDMRSLGTNGRFVAMASNTNSYCYDGTSAMSNGVFTYYYLDALERQGYTTAEGAFDYAEYKSESTYNMDCTSADGYAGELVF